MLPYTRPKRGSVKGALKESKMKDIGGNGMPKRSNLLASNFKVVVEATDAGGSLHEFFAYWL